MRFLEQRTDSSQGLHQHSDTDKHCCHEQHSNLHTKGVTYLRILGYLNNMVLTGHVALKWKDCRELECDCVVWVRLETECNGTLVGINLWVFLDCWNNCPVPIFFRFCSSLYVFLCISLPFAVPSCLYSVQMFCGQEASIMHLFWSWLLATMYRS